ncbi:DUF3306 domain-containing protein [Azospirillum brasilense]|uniref:DUF3306 domain-containing protein n=1 Tax=Azospirillum brasilense TaxID=192 RepID=UPI000E68885F|nr:DUF3306 domain-containing protein [Azospirillum brasilense]NUB23390.1 DUF3306 domain-containing protein [Azospirillum brasilense]NUB35043.1 DUF3306 domain-containing protein [Azospirillum brasilense]RIV98767.1 DUF3306 domain-containing protein [Azospirillum brasilense]
MTDESFLSRWSRLKRQPAAPAPEPVEPPPEEPTAQLPVDATAEPAEASPEAPPESDDPLKDLPPVEELTLESDFTPFLRAEVPDDLHRQALRKLWTSDPVFANDDGLKDYADDYASLFTRSSPVKTLYRVGKGFLDAAEEAAEKAEQATGEMGDADEDGKEIVALPEGSEPEQPPSASPEPGIDMIKRA